MVSPNAGPIIGGAIEASAVVGTPIIWWVTEREEFLRLNHRGIQLNTPHKRDRGRPLPCDQLPRLPTHWFLPDASAWARNGFHGRCLKASQVAKSVSCQ